MAYKKIAKHLAQFVFIPSREEQYRQFVIIIPLPIFTCTLYICSYLFLIPNQLVKYIFVFIDTKKGRYHMHFVTEKKLLKSRKTSPL